jgi:hypothetical protein
LEAVADMLIPHKTIANEAVAQAAANVPDRIGAKA